MKYQKPNKRDICLLLVELRPLTEYHAATARAGADGGTMEPVIASTGSMKCGSGCVRDGGCAGAGFRSRARRRGRGDSGAGCAEEPAPTFMADR